MREGPVCLCSPSERDKFLVDQETNGEPESSKREQVGGHSNVTAVQARYTEYMHPISIDKGDN